MPGELILTIARLACPDRVVRGSLKVVGQRLADLDGGPVAAAGAVDLEGDYLLPGLIETHTDNFEKHLLPRPGVLWPAPLAGLIAHDRQVLAAGITTVLDSLFLGDYVDGSLRGELAWRMVEAAQAARKENLFLADHRLHLRCEVPDRSAWDLFQDFADQPSLRLVSLNDHTPHQRQWSDIEAFKRFHRGKNWTEQEFKELVAHKLEVQKKVAPVNRRRIADFCRTRNLPLATHDDTTPAHVVQAQAEGARISEFPTTLEAAREARARGMMIVAGGPNVVRGSSHSNNVSARQLAREDLLDVLSSDYVPASLLHSAFILHQRLDLPLTETVAFVTANPARMVGLDDRGSLGPGKLADLLRVRMVEELPVVTGVWREGKKVV